jgi:hypothetical protein
MWTSRKTFERSSVDGNAEGEQGTWTFVLTDSGLVTYTKACQILSAKGNSIYIVPDKETRGERERRDQSSSTYSEFVKFAKILQPVIIPCVHTTEGGCRCRGCRFPCARWELVRYSACQYMLPEFLDLMMDR